MRNIYKIAVSVGSLLLVASMLLCVSACDGEPVEDTVLSDTDTQSVVTEQTETRAETELNYDDIDPSDYVSAVTYKGLQIKLEDANASKEDALWEAIFATADISSYPEEKVDYFFEQTKTSYMYLANWNEEDYLLLLKNRGTNEVEMRKEAEQLVKKDLIFYYIVRAENISVSEQEKKDNFDKYVKTYVDTYGYKKDYVIGNMTEIIYDSMLYDKTMEYLISNNTFSVETDTSQSQQKAQG